METRVAVMAIIDYSHRKKTERSEQFLRLAMCGSFE